MLMRRRDLVQPPGADRPVYTEAEARAELSDICSRYAAGVPAAEDAESPPTAAQNGRRLVLTPASEIAPEPVVWAWEHFGQGRIPAGSVGLFAGREGTGKSSFLIWLAAQVTRGELPGAFKGDPRPVIYVTFEDSWKFTIVPRLIAAGADLDSRLPGRSPGHRGRHLLAQPARRQQAPGGGNHRPPGGAGGPRPAPVGHQRRPRHPRQPGSPPGSRPARQARRQDRRRHRGHRPLQQVQRHRRLVADHRIGRVQGRGPVHLRVRHRPGRRHPRSSPRPRTAWGISDLPSLAYRITEAIIPTAAGDARVGRFVLDGEADRTVRDILGSKDGPRGAGRKRPARRTT